MRTKKTIIGTKQPIVDFYNDIGLLRDTMEAKIEHHVGMCQYLSVSNPMYSACENEIQALRTAFDNLLEKLPTL